MAIYLFTYLLRGEERERKRERKRDRKGEKKGERNIDWLPSIPVPTRDQTHNSGMSPDQELTQQPFAG